MAEVDSVKLNVSGSDMPRIVTTESLYRLVETNIPTANKLGNVKQKSKEIETKNENYNINDIIPDSQSGTFILLIY